MSDREPEPMWYDPDDRIQKAVDRFREDDVDAARRMLRALERQGVSSPRIDLYLGHCHLDAGNASAAVMRYRRAAAGAPRRAEPWIGLGLALGREGRLRSARAAFRRAVRLAPELEEAHCQLVHCHVLLGDLDKALRSARRAAALDPTCAQVHRHLAIGFALAGRQEEALAAWRRVAERDPDHPEVAVGTGRALAHLRRGPEARAAFVQALLRDPRDVEARIGMGDLCGAEGRWTQAADHYRGAVEADPRDLEARSRWVDALVELGRPDEALAVLDAARSAAGDEVGDLSAGAPPNGGVGPRPSAARPAGASPHGNDPGSDDLDGDDDFLFAALRGRALAAAGRRRDALGVLWGMAQRRGGDGASLRLLGDQLLVWGRVRAARRVLVRAVRVDPRPVDGWRLLARALARDGRRKAAVAVLSRAAHRHGGHDDLVVDLAAALLAKGRVDGAERALLRGVSYRPESATLWASLAELALDRGRAAEARARVRAALRRDRRQPLALSVLVKWLAARGEWRRVVRAGRAVERVVASSDPVLAVVGRAWLRLGRPAEAAAVLRRYVLAAPGDPQGYALLAEALERLGDEAAASAQRRIADAVGAA